jgi:hypothetical protein
MVPLSPKDIPEDESSLESASEDPATAAQENGHFDDSEEEFHTSSGEDNSEDGDRGEHLIEPTAPLLPPEILKPLPSPAQSPADIPWEKLSRKEKRAERNRSRQAKKRVWDQLRDDAKGTGVLEAGKAAQANRGVHSLKDRVTAGRIEKKSSRRPKTSGRQQLLEHRKRAAAQSVGITESGARKKTKTRPKKKS